jgi:hypothetical protein
MWTFSGQDEGTGNPLNVDGWEECELDDSMKVMSLLGWFDAENYPRQINGSVD